MKKVKDDFLKKNDLIHIQNVIMSNNFPWYYAKSQNKDQKDTSYLFHSFFHDNKINSDFFYIIKPILNILNPTTLINVRANLILNRQNFFCNYHTDTKNIKNTSAIFYVNTNNGYTEFKKNKEKIKCLENRILIFNCNLYHKPVSQTDKDRRIVINLNYF